MEYKIAKTPVHANGWWFAPITTVLVKPGEQWIPLKDLVVRAKDLVVVRAVTFDGDDISSHVSEEYLLEELCRCFNLSSVPLPFSMIFAKAQQTNGAIKEDEYIVFLDRREGSLGFLVSTELECSIARDLTISFLCRLLR